MADEAARPGDDPATAPRQPTRGATYRSHFGDWDTRAWVRAKPRRNSPFRPGLDFFSADLCVPLRHPQVRAAGPRVRRDLLVHCLYQYLEFTVQLETGPVNEACLLLRSPAFLPSLPTGMKNDALRIYTDEAGHAEMSHTLQAAVQEETGVSPLRTEPRFLRELHRLRAGQPVPLRPLVTLLFTVVSETLITGTLTRLPRDERVQRAVRDLACDHAADEGRHHVYFRQLFEWLWPRLPGPTRRRIGVLIPDMILAFLAPDVPAITAILAAVGGFADPARLAAEAAEVPVTRREVRDGARPTLRMLTTAGLLADPVLGVAFRASPLLDAGPLPGE